MTPRALRLHAIQAWDRVRIARLHRRHPGLSLDPGSSTNLATARYELAAGARLRIDAGVVTERRPQGIWFHIGEGADVEIGAGTWLCSDRGPVQIVAFPGARIRLGPECFLNGSHLSAKERIELGTRAWVGFGSRLIDSDQHDFDSEHPEQSAPIRLGDHVWVAADVSVLKGVEIGEHSVVGTRSLVTRSIPPHTLAFGMPAEPRGTVGDRSATR